MTERPARDEDDAQRAARNDLRTLRASDNVFTGSLAAMVSRAGSHFSAKDETSDDPAEIWGKRIGRTLSLAGVFALGIYLWHAYFR